jgi:hypothetical protein
VLHQVLIDFLSDAPKGHLTKRGEIAFGKEVRQRAFRSVSAG